MFHLRMLILLLFSSSSWASSYDPILESMTPGSITFIGESHKHIESVKLVKDLIDVAVMKGQCLTLALEINSNQQSVIDRVLTNGDSVFEIEILQAIDHPPMRRLIKRIAALKMRLPCLNVVAIDAGIDSAHDRDEWMAAKLSNLAGDTPILVLIGALHTLKKVDWLVNTGRPSVAEILTNKGLIVRTFPQRWIPDQCGAGESRYARYVGPDSPEALAILNESMMSLINAKPHESAQGVVDGFVLWECGRQLQTETKELARGG